MVKFIENCAMDACKENDFTVARCESAELMAAECQAKFTNVNFNWQEEFDCGKCFSA